MIGQKRANRWIHVDRLNPNYIKQQDTRGIGIDIQ